MKIHLVLSGVSKMLITFAASVCYYAYGGEIDDVRALMSAAEKGDAAAQCRLAWRYYAGRGVSQSAKEAAKWFRRAAAQGDAEAQSGLALLADKGVIACQPGSDEPANIGVETIENRTVAGYLKAAEQGDAEAQYRLGECYRKGNGVARSDENAASWYLKAAEKGHARAQCALAWCYYAGRGVAQSQEKAAFLFLDAAEQGDEEGKRGLSLCNERLVRCRRAAWLGNAEAQFQLGECYRRGDGVSKSVSDAAAWFQRAAEQGHAMAQCRLAWCCFSGRGVPLSYEDAAVWFRKSAEQGNEEAKKGLSLLKNTIVEHRKAAEKGDAEAQFRLAECYRKGVGTKKSHEEAVAWYRKAAEQKHAAAQYMLAVCYYKGWGVSKSGKDAAAWYRKAAEQGYADAQCGLGGCYLDGVGVSRSNKKAIIWFQKAAEQGHAVAAAVLSRVKVLQVPTPASETRREGTGTHDYYTQPTAAYNGISSNDATWEKSKPVASSTHGNRSFQPVSYQEKGIPAHSITECRRGADSRYSPLDRATLCTPSGKTETYTGRNIPSGMKPVIVHGGRPDNGTSWGKHIEYVPMSRREAAIHQLKNTNAVECIVSMTASGIEDISEERYAEGAVKTAVGVGAGLLILNALLGDD